MIKKRFIFPALRHIVAITFVLVIMVPFALAVLNSFKTSADAAQMSFALPDSLHFENYTQVFEEVDIFRAYFNSLIVTVPSVVIEIVIASAAAFVLSRRRTKTFNLLYFILVGGLVAPINYTTTFFVMDKLQLINTYGGLILFYVARQLPFNIFLFYGFMANVPEALDEAAHLEGCGPVRLFFQMTFPLLKPVIFTAFILMFVNTWNDFVSPLYFLGTSEKQGIVMTMFQFNGMYSRDLNLICAAVVIIILPVMIIYMIGQKYIISGMSAGSVKG